MAKYIVMKDHVKTGEADTHDELDMALAASGISRLDSKRLIDTVIDIETCDNPDRKTRSVGMRSRHGYMIKIDMEQ